MQHCTRASGRVCERLGSDLRAAIDHTKSLPGQFAGMRGELMAVFKGYYMCVNSLVDSSGRGGIWRTIVSSGQDPPRSSAICGASTVSDTYMNAKAAKGPSLGLKAFGP